MTVPAPAAPLPVLVVGGGLSGLSLAAWLRSLDSSLAVPSLLLERSPRPGGVMDTLSLDGFLFERGPNTILDKLPELNELLDLLSLSSSALRTPLRGHKRYIFSGGRLVPVPGGPGSLLLTSLLSPSAKLRLLREPFLPPVEADETLRDMIVRRLGPETYERMFLPMVQGIWAGDPARMSAERAFPLLKELERESGSLIRGFVARMKQAKRERPPGAPRPSPAMVTFPGGLRRLPEALASYIGDAFRPNCEVERIVPPPAEGAPWTVEGRENGAPARWTAERVVVCAEAPAAARLVREFEPALADRLDSIRYCAFNAVGLGIDARAASIPPGFGFLARRDQGLRVLGAIFNSNFQPDRAPAGCAALTVMLGGDLDPEAASLDDNATLAVLRRDLARAIGWNGEARAFVVNRHPAAVPQYDMDHGARMAAVAEAEARRPGLRFLGNWRGGVAVPDRIRLAKELARSIANEATREPRGSAPIEVSSPETATSRSDPHP